MQNFLIWSLEVDYSESQSQKLSGKAFDLIFPTPLLPRTNHSLYTQELFHTVTVQYNFNSQATGLAEHQKGVKLFTQKQR